MTFTEAVMQPNPMTPHIAIIFHEDKCIGCNRCINVCRADVLHPNPVKGNPPVVLYPDECWFDGCCVLACRIEGASELNSPLQQKTAWKRKDTGEFFRVGMKNPPPPYTRPPAGEKPLPAEKRVRH